MIVDEAHHIGAPAFSQFMFKLCPKYTLGLTATPERKDGLTRLLYWFMGKAFFTLERTEQKHVQVNKFDFASEVFRQGVPLNRMGQISLAEMVTTLTEIPERNQLILDIIKGCRGRKVLLLTDRRQHCFWLNEKIAGSALYIGGMSENDLEISSKSDVILATFSQAHEGLDIPTLDTVILATPHSDVKQAVGRILRGGNRNSPVIYDIVDKWSVLFAMWQKRLTMYKQSGFETEAFETGCLF
jgi:superfamily II DNA or RNA helicase